MRGCLLLAGCIKKRHSGRAEVLINVIAVLKRQACRAADTRKGELAEHQHAC